MVLFCTITALFLLVKMKVRDILRVLKADGWYQIKSKGGSHRQFKHQEKPGKVTVAGQLNDDIHPKTLSSILQQASLQ